MDGLNQCGWVRGKKGKQNLPTLIVFLLNIFIAPPPHVIADSDCFMPPEK